MTQPELLQTICVPFWWNKIPLSNWFKKKNESAISDLMYILNVKILAAEIIDWKKNSLKLPITHKHLQK